MNITDDLCLNCGTTDPADEIESGLCYDCMRSMPMDGWYTAGTWEKIAED